MNILLFYFSSIIEWIWCVKWQRINLKETHTFMFVHTYTHISIASNITNSIWFDLKLTFFFCRFSFVLNFCFFFFFFLKVFHYITFIWWFLSYLFVVVVLCPIDLLFLYFYWVNTQTKCSFCCFFFFWYSLLQSIKKFNAILYSACSEFRSVFQQLSELIRRWNLLFLFFFNDLE